MSTRLSFLLAGMLFAGVLLAAAATAAAPPGPVPAVAGQPSVVPWPVGPGPAYRPPAADADVEAGLPIGPLRCTEREAVYPLHLELFADRRVIVVPAGIGVARPWLPRGGAVVADGCTYPAWTLTPTGIVEVARGARLRLSDLFRIWGQALGTHRLVSFRSSSPLRAYVGGHLVRGPAAAIPLTPRAEIVLELGGYVAPHASFLFAGVAP